MQQSTNVMVRMRRVASVMVAASLLMSCGGSDDTSTDATDAPATEAAPVTAPPDEPTDADSDDTVPSTSDDDVGAGGVGQAIVDVGGDVYEFVVIQCLRDVTGPLSDTVIEFQLDAVPAATPPDAVERLLGVIGEDVDVLAELEPVVEFGPILSITRVAGGGEAFYVTDLDTIEITSDGDPTDPASRSLDVSPDATGATVTGTSTANGLTVTIDATCP